MMKIYIFLFTILENYKKSHFETKYTRHRPNRIPNKLTVNLFISANFWPGGDEGQTRHNHVQPLIQDNSSSHDHLIQYCTFERLQPPTEAFPEIDPYDGRCRSLETDLCLHFKSILTRIGSQKSIVIVAVFRSCAK